MRTGTWSSAKISFLLWLVTPFIVEAGCGHLDVQPSELSSQQEARTEAGSLAASDGATMVPAEGGIAGPDGGRSASEDGGTTGPAGCEAHSSPGPCTSDARCEWTGSACTLVCESSVAFEPVPITLSSFEAAIAMYTADCGTGVSCAVGGWEVLAFDPCSEPTVEDAIDALTAATLIYDPAAVVDRSGLREIPNALLVAADMAVGATDLIGQEFGGMIPCQGCDAFEYNTLLLYSGAGRIVNVYGTYGWD